MPQLQKYYYHLSLQKMPHTITQQNYQDYQYFDLKYN